MGREATITYEQIAAVADAMKVEGLKPTSRAVRERAGGTGSMGTINKLLGRWKAGQERQISAALVLPPALQRVLLEFMDNELTATRMPLEAELAEQLQEASDMAEENERQALENQEQAEAIGVTSGNGSQRTLSLRGCRNPAVQSWHGHAQVLGHVARRHAAGQQLSG